MKVSVYEAKSKLSQMINKALEGEEVVITRNGKETVKLVPATNGNRNDSWIGMWKGQITVPDSFYEPLEEEAYLTGDAETFLDKVMKEDKAETDSKE